MLALATTVGHQGVADVLGVLARDHGHTINFGEAGLVTGNAVATDAHGNFLFAGLGVTLQVLGQRLAGRKRDSDEEGRSQELFHFGMTIQGV